ncbi:MAG: hypothetical protein FJX47_09850 [Alphaproteobacteria bacterium]|nr:hypothetical protein [Alphaproteobacteria bacterium]
MLSFFSSLAQSDQIQEATAILHRHLGAQLIEGNGFLALGRNATFRNDPGFSAAMGEALGPEDAGRAWSLHVLTWAIEATRGVAGDVIALGGSPRIIDFLVRASGAALGTRTMKIYTSVAQDRHAEFPKGASVMPLRPGPQDWPNAVSCLIAASPESEAELEAIARLVPRLRPGAMVVIEEFGLLVNGLRFRVLSEIFARVGRSILEIPTGQGLVFWWQGGRS